MHDEESPTAQSAASWFANPKSEGSAHLCVDDTVTYRTLSDTTIPWGAQGANEKGFHIEQAGYAKWTETLWSKRHRRTLQRAAYKTAAHCLKFKIPPRFVFAADLKAGRRGVTTHAQCTLAFGGSHTDPGKSWPRHLFMGLVRAYYLQIKLSRKKH